MINQIAALYIDGDDADIKPDPCQSGKGGISGIRVLGGRGPYLYTWRDENNKVIASTADLNEVNAGKYTLQVADALGSVCTVATREFEIEQVGEALSPPELSDVTICAPGMATLSVRQPKTGKYKVYQNLESLIPLAESSNGIINMNVDGNSTFYVSYSNSSCESSLVPVRVFVFSNDVLIPNTISPNGDLINDTWEIKGLNDYQPQVTIYNRYGQAVFRSKGYQTPFNGERNGKPLPAGTYYYVINLREDCKMIKGSIFIAR